MTPEPEAGRRPESAPSAPAPVRGAILAGGAASRYGGRPKGLETVAGRRILDRVVDALVEATGRPPLLVANAPEARSWRPDLRVVADREPGRGTLGGLYTAVLEAPAPVLCVAWDMPFVPAALLTRLAAGLAEHDVSAPASAGRRGLEPLAAGYGPGCLAPMARALARGDYRAVAFHDEVRVAILSADEVAGFGDPTRLFFNVNTADDLTRARSL